MNDKFFPINRYPPKKFHSPKIYQCWTDINDKKNADRSLI